MISRRKKGDPKAWSLKPPKPSSPSPVDLQKKAETINLLLLQPDVDLWKLRELCLTEGGLVNDTLRKRAWPKLVGLSPYKLESNTMGSPKRKGPGVSRSETIDENPHEDDHDVVPTTPTTDSAPQFHIDTLAVDQEGEADDIDQVHSDDEGVILFPLHVPACVDAEQIERDVARCTWHLLTGDQRSRRLQHENKHRKKVANLLKKKQKRLANLINLTLSSSEEPLRYYQGYHDVACIFLHALGSDGNDQDPLGVDLPARVLGQVSLFHLRDSCSSSFQSLQQCLHWTIFPLLAKLDPQLHNHLKDCDMEPFFCLSWIITWFAHDVRDTNLVKRLFDAFLVSHPLLVLYVSVAMMIHPVNRKIILETDCDFAALHHTLSMLPRHSSTVGWKKARQGGYISADIVESDEEEEEEEGEGIDDNDVAEQWDDSVAASDDAHGQSHATSTTAGTTSLTPTPSINSSTNGALVIGDKHGTVQGDNQEKVPFQVLVDTALGYMQYYPPTCLMELASWYYQQELFDAASPSAHNIRMLQPSPVWAIDNSITADWVDKQRIRQEMGLAKTSRKDRRRKRILAGNQGDEIGGEILPLENISKLSVEEYLKLYRRSMAVIASGQGPFGAKEHELYQKRLKVAMRGAVVVGLSAIVIGVLRQSANGNDTGIVAMPEPLQVALKQESFVEIRVPEASTTDSATCGVSLDLPVTEKDFDSKITPPLMENAKKAGVTTASVKPMVVFTAKSLNKVSADTVGSKPALPDTLTPADLFPSPGNTRQVEPKGENPDHLTGKLWNKDLKKVPMIVYRYLYHWTSKLIIKPLQFIKKFLK